MVKSINQGRWTDKEHSIFITGIKLRLKWEQIAELVGTRNADQCRSHYQKFKQSQATSPSRRLILADKSTQYEPPITFFSYQPVFLVNPDEDFGCIKKNLCTDDTMSSEYDFNVLSFDYDDFLIQ